MITKGFNDKYIREKYSINATDLTRIRQKTLWKMAWNIHDNFINKQ